MCAPSLFLPFISLWPEIYNCTSERLSWRTRYSHNERLLKLETAAIARNKQWCGIHSAIAISNRQTHGERTLARWSDWHKISITAVNPQRCTASYGSRENSRRTRWKEINRRKILHSYRSLSITSTWLRCRGPADRGIYRLAICPISRCVSEIQSRQLEVQGICDTPRQFPRWIR